MARRGFQRASARAGGHLPNPATALESALTWWKPCTSSPPALVNETACQNASLMRMKCTVRDARVYGGPDPKDEEPRRAGHAKTRTEGVNSPEAAIGRVSVVYDGQNVSYTTGTALRR